MSVRTNGKVDGSVRINGGTPLTDEITMTFAGALPLVLRREARRVANIGFGTGMTTHVLLASPTIERVDTIEIEPAMVKAGELLRRVNARAGRSAQPLPLRGRQDLFRRPAAALRRDHLRAVQPLGERRREPVLGGVLPRRAQVPRARGLFVQWVQLYETTPKLLATIVAALEENFSDYEFWLANDHDLLIIASHRGMVPSPGPARL